MKFLIGDEVKVLSGKDKGKIGKIEKILPKKQAVIITNINMYKRHTKPKSQTDKGGIIDIVKPLPSARVQLMCPKCKSMTRIGYQIAQGKKVRICRKCEQEL